MKRSVRTFAAVLAVLLLLPGAAVVAKSKELNFALSGNPDSLDPQKTAGTLTFQTVKSIYDTLVEVDQTEKLVPALAESWSVSPDGLVWTFKLRPGVVFHNGQKLTSKDVKATFDRIKAKETAAPKAGEFAAISTIGVPNATTVVFTLSKPYAPFLGLLASGWAAILPSSLIEKGHDFAKKPVGTGPFVMKEWVRDSRIVLEKNKSYWIKGCPRVDRVVMNIIPERAVQVQGLMSGAVDAVEFVADFATSAKGYSVEAEIGHVTIVVDRGSGELVGAAMACPDASAAIHECVLAIRARVPIEVLADTIHAFPSTSRILNGLFDEAKNRLAAERPTA